MSTQPDTVLALTGGVGGAKLVLGLEQELPAQALHVLVNTGDDFEHLGLHICPDIDTLLYTLSGLSNQQQGWGLANETWNTMASLEKLGGDTWFRLGDRDMATHLWRRQQLSQGQSISEVTAQLAQRLGVQPRIYPMSDDPVRTTVHTAEGDLPFQHYFVKEQCRPAVTGFSFEGISAARPNRDVARLLEQKQPSLIIICPSNPFVSVDPILQVPGLWLALRDNPAPVILVSPIVAGLAIKGPAAKMMAELDVPVTASGIAHHYCNRYPGLVDHFVIDESDETLAQEIAELDLEVAVTRTIMKTTEDKRQLARFILNLASEEV